jgi:uncharacterized alpha/beta hydrolase family protein/uncharacterized protein YukE
MSIFEGDHSAVRAMARQFSEQAEVLREKRRGLMSRISQVQSGTDAWEGEGAKAYVLQMEQVTEELGRMNSAGHQIATVLYQVGDRLYGLQELRSRLKHLESELHSATMVMAMSSSSGYVNEGELSRVHSLSTECSHLRAMVQQYEVEYDREAAQAFSAIMSGLPMSGELQDVVRTLTQQLFDRSHLPVLIQPDAGHFQPGREKIAYLNETIRMNQAVYDYYKAHAEAIGPNGESAEQMMGQAHALMENARKDGGTYGVPILFVHGLKGDGTTFKEMVEYLGGISMVYTIEKSGDMLPTPGKNNSQEHPVIQIVFKDGTMSFDEQVGYYKEMTAQLKKDSGTDYMMVVSHSMGGVITTQYIEETGGDDITRFVTLGSPIHGSKADELAHKAIGVLSPTTKLIAEAFELNYSAIHDLRSDSAATKQILKDKGHFNPDIEVFSGAGTGAGMLGDTVVLPDSALALEQFVGAENYSGKIYPDDTHSELHDDPLAIEDVMNFILNGERPKYEK